MAPRNDVSDRGESRVWPRGVVADSDYDRGSGCLSWSARTAALANSPIKRFANNFAAGTLSIVYIVRRGI